MILLLLARLAVLGVRAEEPTPVCWTARPEYFAARIENAADNLVVLAEPRRFGEICGAGVVVANGTFFGPGGPLGDVLVNGAIPYAIKRDERRVKRGTRLVDLGKRWGIGVVKNSKTLAMADGNTALMTMSTYLGGGGILLSDGEDVSPLNEPVAGRWGASFPKEIMDDARGRTALGIKDENGRQVLLVVGTRDAAHATVSDLAFIMKGLGANEAVFYDGGGAQGFAAGGVCRILPASKEDLNPTHIVIKACR